MAVDVEHVGTVLLGAGADEEIRECHTMPAARGQFALRGFGGRHRGGVDPQVPVGVEILPQREEVLTRPRAVEDLQARDRAHAQLAVVHEAGATADPGRLVEQDQRHAPSPISSSTSTS